MSSKRSVVVKVAKMPRVITVNNVQYIYGENIVSEGDILASLADKRPQCPDSIVKYVDFFSRYIPFSDPYSLPHSLQQGCI